VDPALGAGSTASSRVRADAEETENPMHTPHEIKGIEELVDERIRRWEAVPSHEKEQRRVPVIAISREEGSLGEASASRLAQELGMDYYDDELIRSIAETAHISESVVRTLDEKGTSFVDDLFRHAVGRYGLTSDRYFDMLAKIIAAINWHGNGIIVGRGSAYLVHGPTDLTVRFVAPKLWRVDNLMRERGLTKAQALRRIREADRDRREFVWH
jgi:cytidylate kinase